MRVDIGELTAAEIADATGLPRLNLMVRAGNAGVLGFYDGLGYRQSDIVVLQRDLKPPAGRA